MRRMRILPALGLLLAAPAALAGQTVTQLLWSGPNGSKENLVVIGDGFTTNDQATFNAFVDTLVIQGVFSETGSGVYRETMNAYNIFRVNANSVQSGITTVDSNGTVVNTVNTFLGYRFSGRWNRCWMEKGPTSDATMTATLNNLVPGWTKVFIVLNTSGFGGCRRGNTLAITRGVTWTVGAHEMGHMMGNLGDEYTGTAAYTGAEPGNPNLTINTARTTLKWRDFVNPSTAVPTPTTFGGSAVNDAGLFAGGTTGGTRFGSGIFRPSINDRMNGNSPDFDPVCYDQMQNAVDARHDYVYRNVYVGRFNPDGRDDIMLHNANSIALYTGNTDWVDVPWVRTLPDPVWDAYRPGDQFYVGDFDGDGMDDLFVFNATDWAIPYFAMLRSTGNGFVGVRRFDQDLPGWGAMERHDKFYVGDFDGDGKADVMVFNGDDFSIGYFLLLRSTGSDLVFVKRFDQQLPGWDDMKRHDQFFVADFDSDRRDDIYVFNGDDWSVGYLEMLRATGNDLAFTRRFDQQLPGWDDMKPHDQFYVADFDADRRQDLYVFNGPDWSMSYLEMLRSTGTNLTNSHRFDGDVPGWGGMASHDQWFVADLNGDGRDDLYAYNWRDWATEYLGAFRSSGTNLSGGWQDDWIGSWNLGQVDQFRVMNFNGGPGWQDLVVFNDDWLGLLRSLSGSSSLSAIYPKWIHNHNYHTLGWW